MERNYYTVNEAADKLGLHPLTVYRWLRTGVLRGFKFGTWQWRVPVAEVERVNNGQPQEATSANA